MNGTRKPPAFSREVTIEQSNLLLLSERKAFTMETKFITHLNEKYLQKTAKNSPPNSTFPLELPQIPLQQAVKPQETPKEEKKEAISHKKHKKIRIITEKVAQFSQYEATPSPLKRKAEEKEQKPAGLVRSNTMSPTKPALKPRYSDESPTKRRHRVKFNKKDQVFKVENFKADLKRLKFTANY